MRLKRNFNQWLEERTEVLRSLDRERIIDYCERNNFAIPLDEIDFWAGVHSARLAVNLSDSEHELSRRWLAEHGLEPYPQANYVEADKESGKDTVPIGGDDEGAA